MIKLATPRFPFLMLVGAASFGLLAAPALALPNVVFVSGKGSNANACDTVAAPCLTLQAAHNKVAAGGEIVVLDGGSYGPVGITKSISIVNDGTGVADVQQTVAGANAISINAGSSGVVHLRGLSLDGAGVAANGVGLVAAGSLTIVNCVARRFTGAGFFLRPSGATNVAILDSIASDNARGIHVAPVGGSAKGVLSNVQASGNSQFGVLAAGAVAMTVTDGAFSKNASGVFASAGASIMVRDSASSNNASAGYVASGSGAILRLAHSVASGNNIGFQAAGGGVGETYGDNNLRGNGAAISAGVSTVATQ